MPDLKSFLEQAKAREAEKAARAEAKAKGREDTPSPPKKKMSVRGMRPDMYHMLVTDEPADSNQRSQLDQALNAQGSSPANEVLTPTRDIRNSDSEPLNASVKNTDKIPTTSSAHSEAVGDNIKAECRQNTDNESSSKSGSDSAGTDKIPTTRATSANQISTTNTDKVPTTQNEANQDPSGVNAIKRPSTDKIPATAKRNDTGEYRQNTDNILSSHVGGNLGSSDKIPTTSKEVHGQRTETNTDKIPTTNSSHEQRPKNIDQEVERMGSARKEAAEYRQNADKEPTKPHSRTGNVPTKSRQNTDRVPTIVPTTEFSVVGINTDNEIELTPAVIEERILNLSGGQRDLLLHCYGECIARSSNSFPTLYPELAKATSIADGSIRTTAKILKSRQLIQIDFKKGPGGNITIAIPEQVFRILTRLSTFGLLSADKIPTTKSLDYRQNTDNSADKIGSSSSSNLNYKSTTTTSGEPLSALWEEIDFSQLSHIGFSGNHVRQIATHGKLTPDQLQDSIRYFAFDLAENGKAKRINGSELNFFMGILRRGSPYTPPDNYVSDEERALKAILERKKAEAERLRKLQEEILEFDFENWLAGLPLVERLKRVPESDFVKAGSAPHRAMLRQYFAEHEWSGATQ